MKSVISQYQGIIGRSKTRLDAEMLNLATGLAFIGRGGAGLDDIDLALCKERNIAVINAPEGNRDAVGEHALGMLLSVMNRLHIAWSQMREGSWQRQANRGTELGGKTVGIIGYGNMGRAFARKLGGFNVRVLAYDKYLSQLPDSYATFSDMETLFNEADVISLHVPLTDETRGMVNIAWLSRFKRRPVLVNTARGQATISADILSALETGLLSGAALDVLENEKPSSYTPAEQEIFNRLSARPDVLLTPHIAGWTQESYLRINEVLVRKIRLFLEEKSEQQPAY